MPPRDPEPEPSPEVLELAEQLLAAPPAERDALQRRFAAEQPQHAAALALLLRDLAGVDRLFAAGYAGDHGTDPAAIGGYRVLRRLGDGAFGTVYLCAQTTPVRREVAIKVLRPGAGERGSLQRFQAERQYLAQQNHPAVIQVFDAGELPDGRPYFVMEYVPGTPISDYCDRTQLPIRARVELFLRLCAGVEHAHAHGIVHRDLKPANILVVEVDGLPQPKIIDFGIARVVDPERQTDGAQPGAATETGRVVGTPGYMSPEQAQGQRDAIDASSDVFALGVILYELLTGELPWGRRPTTTETEPLRPSRRVTADRTRITTVAERRASDPRRLVTSLRGDLDWIVMKALQQDRRARYASAGQLAADLARHLTFEAVHAGPPALHYRVGKALRRHRARASSAAILLLAAAGVFAVQQHYERRWQQREQDANAAVAALLARANDVAMVRTPNSAPLRQGLMQDALSFYDRFLGERPEDDRTREARAKTLTSLSQVYWLLGQYREAVAAARDAVADGEQLLAGAPQDGVRRGLLGAALRNLGRALVGAGDAAAARVSLQRAVELLDVCHVEAPRRYQGLLSCALVELATTMDAPADATAHAAHLERARALQEAALADAPNDDNRRTLITTNLGLLRHAIATTQPPAAFAALARMQALLAALTQPDPTHTLRVHQAAAELATLQGHTARAITHLQTAIAAGVQLCAQDTTRPEPLRELGDLHAALAGQHYGAGRLPDGDAAMRAALDVMTTQVERFPDDPVTRLEFANRVNFLLASLLTTGRRSVLGEAESWARRAVAVVEPVPREARPQEQRRLRLLLDYRFARVLAALGHPEAEVLRQRVGEDFAAFQPVVALAADHAAEAAEIAVWLASHCAAGGFDADEERWLASAEATLAAFPELARHALRRAQVGKLRSQQATRRGDVEEAIELAEQAAETGAGWQSALAAADGLWRAAQATGGAAAGAHEALQRACARWQQAADLLQIEARQTPDDPWVVLPLAHCRIHLARAALAEHRRDAARASLQEALAALERQRADAFADEWNQALVDEAKAMLGQL